MNTKIGTIIVAWSVLLSVGRLASATPVIKDFSSTGVRTPDGWVYIYRDDRLEFIAHDEVKKNPTAGLTTALYTCMTGRKRLQRIS